MDFEKHAREILSKIEDDHQYKFSAYDALLEQALRAAYLAGKEEMRLQAALDCENEAEKCIGDIVPGDQEGAKLAYARASALMTAGTDIRSLPLSDPSQVKKEKV